MKLIWSFLVLISLVGLGRAEYIWNGQDWVWKEDSAQKSVGQSATTDEGSGATDIYDDEDENGWEADYDQGSGDLEEEVEPYKPQRGNKKKNNKKNKDRNRNKQEDVYGWNRGQEDNYNTNSYPEEKETQNTYNTYNNNNYNPTPDNSDDFYVEGPAQTPDVPPREPERYPPDTHEIDDSRSNTNFNNYDRPPVDKSKAGSFFAQPGTLAAVFGGAVVGLLCAILCVMFVVYRMRKKDEGSYMACDSLSKRSQANASYSKQPREFFA